MTTQPERPAPPRLAARAEGLMAGLGAAGASRGPAPVHLWDPPFCGDIDMRIARDGTWFHEGTPIGRPGLVRLFAGILKREGDAFFLVTPVEKVGIRVEDAPFVAVDFEMAEGPDGAEAAFTTNVGDRTVAGPGAALRVPLDPETGEPAPYVMVRAGLEARIDRKSWLRMVEACGVERRDGREWFGLRSRGAFFPLVPADALG